MGSGLSPNGIGLTRAGMVNLALMDKVLEVDKEKKRVRVQAGIRVQQLVDEIKEYGLTLQNFASIREQQIGGIVQVTVLRKSWDLYDFLVVLTSSCIVVFRSVLPFKNIGGDRIGRCLKECLYFAYR